MSSPVIRLIIIIVSSNHTYTEERQFTFLPFWYKVCRRVTLEGFCLFDMSLKCKSFRQAEAYRRSPPIDSDLSHLQV